MKELLRDASGRAIDYLESLGQRRVAPLPGAVEKLEEFVHPLADAGMAPAAVLDMLDRLGTPASTAMAGPRYFGFVIGGATPASVAANWLATAWDQNTGLHATTPCPAILEQVSLDWMIDLMGLPAGCGGSFVTGATVANFTVLAAARHRVLSNAGWDVEADGLFGAPPIDVVISEESHPSVYKALGLLGLGRQRVKRVPIDAQGRLRVEAMPALSGPTIIVTQVGNVNTGACDPVGRVCDIAAEHGAWVHVDGAFGLWAGASPAHRHLVQGMERADSWATDAHKWLNVPYDSGVAFVKDTAALKAAMAITAEYLPTASTHRNPSDYTPELSRRARGVDVWAALLALGRDGVANLIDNCCSHARHFAQELSAAGYEVLNEVVLNQVLVSFGDAHTTRRVIEGIQADGTCWAGVTVWQGRTAMRISVSNHATTRADVNRSIEAIKRVAGSL